MFIASSDSATGDLDDLDHNDMTRLEYPATKRASKKAIYEHLFE
jgi:hypothetical protein